VATKLLEVKEELRRRMHRPIPEQGEWLKRVVSGFFNYHAVPTNGRALSVFRHRVTVLWQRTLRRRSQKDRTAWDRMAVLVDDWLPRARILHPWPSARFAVRHPRWEPYAGKRGAPSNGRPYRDPACAGHDDGARPRFHPGPVGRRRVCTHKDR
jgi:hypothetical protein